VPELRALTARNPDWALALRKLVDAAQSDRLTPEQLIRLLEKAPRMSAPSKSPPSQSAAVTPPLFGA
jgi:hypothetical protein